jgi:hypothetical protein
LDREENTDPEGSCGPMRQFARFAGVTRPVQIALDPGLAASVHRPGCFLHRAGCPAIGC